jgi:hypothetical protein
MASESQLDHRIPGAHAVWGGVWAPDAEGGGAVAASGPPCQSKFRLVDQRIGGDMASAFSSCGHGGTLASGSNGPTLLQKSKNWERRKSTRRSA